MLRDRILSAVLFGVPALAAIIAGGIWLALAILIVFGFGLGEFVRLVARRGHRASGGLTLLWLWLFVADRLFPDAGLLAPGIALLLLLTLAWTLVRYRQGTANALTGFAMTIAGSFYIGWSGAHFIALRSLPDGLFWTLTVLGAVWATDTGAYAVGKLLGHNRIMPDVSPGKTWEGYVGGVIAGTLASALLPLAWQALGASPAVSPMNGLIIGALVSTLSPLGDFGISLVKRYAGAKDSSHLIPGHGGFLDRVDALLVGGLLGYYFLMLFVL
jgi:phosphatidate cytidylyltransferase